MIRGIGLECIEIAEFDRELERRGIRSIEDVLLPGESEYCSRMAEPAPSRAARLAAKEALLSALGAPRRHESTWRDIEVVRDDKGKPALRLHGETASFAERQGVARIHVSLSHSRGHAAAVVVVE